VIAAVVAVVSLIAAPQPAAAACSPTGRGTAGFAGYAGTQGSVSGVNDVASSIREYMPYVYPGSQVSQWVMLNNGGTEWAQVGAYQDVTTHYTFEQHTDNSGHYYTNWWSYNGAGYNGYEVSFNASTHVFGFYRNGSILTSSTQLWNPGSYQLYGETHDQSDQMPGGYNNHSVFIYATYNHTTSVSSAAGTNQSTWYGATKVGAGDYEIWDKACPS
jgi:hypothetical protein